MNSSSSRKSTVKRLTLIVLVLFVAVAVVAGTYARYTNTASGTATVDLAKWSVKIDGTQMNSIATGELNVPLTYVPNSYASANKLAPNGNVYFEFIIDPAESEVAIDYNVALGAVTGLTDAGSEVKLLAASYTIEGGTTQNATISEGATTMSFTESLAQVEAGKRVTVRGFISWENVGDANSAADTVNGLADQDLSATVTITASQHI